MIVRTRSFPSGKSGFFRMAEGGVPISVLLTVDRIACRPAMTGVSEPLFAGLSLTVARGEFVSVVGPSGCGKSTLFRMIAGLAEPDEGRITLHGSPEGERLGRIGFMPQQDLLLPWRTVMDNCLLPLELKRPLFGARPSRQREEILTLLKAFGLGGRENDYPEQLSGGMRQRAAFLRAYVTGAELLLLDEPFGALDAITKREMHEWLLRLWEGLDQSVLFVTHDLEEALLLSDRICLFVPGSGLIEFPVRLPRPRSSRMRFEPSFAGLREELETLMDEGRRDKGALFATPG